MLTGKNVVYVIKKDEIVQGHHCATVSGGIYTGPQLHKWWLAGRFDELRQECVVTRHTVKAGQGMIIPAHRTFRTLCTVCQTHSVSISRSKPLLVQSRHGAARSVAQTILCLIAVWSLMITSDFHFTNRKWTQTCGNR